MMNNFKQSQGSILLTVLITMFILAIGVAALMMYTGTGITQVKATGFSMKAFYTAEAGLQLGIKMMADDLRYTPEGEELSWSDGTINGPKGPIAVAGLQEYPDFTTIIPETVYFSNVSGTYEVSIASVAGDPHKIWVRSVGQVQNMTRTVVTQLGLRNISPWNNAIFAGEGASGGVISGNVDIRGSVHLLGNSILDSDPAMSLSGNGNIGNNYIDMPAALSSRVPSILKPFAGGMAEDLETNVRVKNGTLELSGTGEVGQDQGGLGAGYKGLVEGVFTSDGYGGNQGTNNVYSDNGTGHGYDCGDRLTFPKITDPYEGYASYVEYLRANALVIDNADSLAVLADIEPETTFSASNGKGSITLDGNGNMDVDGIILIDGPVAFSGKLHDVISYTGKASIMVNGDITFQVDVLTKWLDTYPADDMVAFMTPNSMMFDKPQLAIMGLFYAEDTITSKKQTHVAGTFFSNYFDMGLNVPAIYQVPDTTDNLPPGIIGSEDIWVLTQNLWAER
jgi:hypothetical protein